MRVHGETGWLGRSFFLRKLYWHFWLLFCVSSLFLVLFIFVSCVCMYVCMRACVRACVFFFFFFFSIPLVGELIDSVPSKKQTLWRVALSATLDNWIEDKDLLWLYLRNCVQDRDIPRGCWGEMRKLSVTFCCFIFEFAWVWKCLKLARVAILSENGNRWWWNENRGEMFV